MDITLHEKVNADKLQEVIVCNNLPFGIDDDPSWREVFKTQLKLYSKKKKTDGWVQVKYTQTNKFGRYVTRCGLQGFQKDVRKYISGEFVRDLDFENCHPVILEQLFKKHGLYGGEFLEQYNMNRKECVDKFKLGDKRTLIKVINNEAKPLNLVDLHSRLYDNLVPVLLKDKSLKNMATAVRKKRVKEGKNYNHLGAFVSQYLQDIENMLLMALYQYLCDCNVKVHSLFFDGLTINKDAVIEFDKCEQHIKEQTGYTIKIVEKSTHTDWKPECSENVVLEEIIENGEVEEYSVVKNRLLYEACVYTDENDKKVYDHNSIRRLTEYINKFVCMVNNPLAHAWRFRTDEAYTMRRLHDIKHRVRFGFECKDPIIQWGNQDKALIYDRFVFKPDESKVGKGEYNLYMRPEMCEGDVDGLLLFDFLKRVICSNDERLYNYILHYIAKMVRVGKTKQLLVLLGDMGTGKSTFCDILKLIIGKNYHCLLNDINMLTEHFNSLYETAILTQVEEVVHNANEYHKVQEVLKTLTTENDIRIVRKGVDAYMTTSQNNFVLLTNHYNPIKITGDNRRVCVIQMSEVEKNNTRYFSELKQQVLQHIKAIRHYFYTFDFNDDLNSIRPTTEAEAELREMNMSGDELFIRDALEIPEEGREFQGVYQHYKAFCMENGKRYYKDAYFSAMLRRRGFRMQRITVEGHKCTWIWNGTARETCVRRD